jgi:hypothetical protein
MRKSLVIAVGCAFLLFAVAATAQTSDNSGQYGNQSTTSKTETQSSTSQSSTSTQMGAPSGAQTVEGCLVREQTDYFLVPQSGNPIKVQASAGEDYSEHAGHKVKVTGSESALSEGGMGSSAGTAGTAASTPATGSQAQTSSSGAMSAPAGSAGSSSAGSGMATGTGNDLHRMADQQITVIKLQHIAATCPVNWNPKVPTPSGSSGMGPH